MDFSAINFWAVLAAALAAFVLGGLWYSPVLFGDAWLRLSGVDDESRATCKRPASVVYGVSFVLSLAAALVFAMFLGPQPALGFAIGVGFLTGFVWVAGSFGINYLFESKSFQLWAINGGYHTVQFVLYGVILGAWH